MGKAKVSTDAALREQIGVRIERAKSIPAGSLRELYGVFQFGDMTLSADEQFANAKRFWKNVVAECDSCGGVVYRDEPFGPQPDCGHVYCGLHLGRGRGEDCCVDKPTNLRGGPNSRSTVGAPKAVFRDESTEV